MLYYLLGLAALLLLIAGTAKAAVDIMSHQPDNNIFMNWGAFFDNRNSWKRKYKDYDSGDLRPRFLGSKTWAAFLTDFWHLCDFVYLKAYLGAGMAAGAALAKNSAPWWAYAAAVAGAAIELGGIFELLYRRKFRIRPVAE